MLVCARAFMANILCTLTPLFFFFFFSFFCFPLLISLSELGEAVKMRGKARYTFGNLVEPDINSPLAQHLAHEKAETKMLMYKAEVALLEAKVELEAAQAEEARGTTTETKERVRNALAEVSRCKSNYDKSFGAFTAASETASKAAAAALSHGGSFQLRKLYIELFPTDPFPLFLFSNTIDLGRSCWWWWWWWRRQQHR